MLVCQTINWFIPAVSFHSLSALYSWSPYTYAYTILHVIDSDSIGQLIYWSVPPINCFSRSVLRITKCSAHSVSTPSWCMLSIQIYTCFHHALLFYLTSYTYHPHSPDHTHCTSACGQPCKSLSLPDNPPPHGVNLPCTYVHTCTNACTQYMYVI